MNKEEIDNYFPQKYGNFLLLDFIGKGGMAEIFLAQTRLSLGHLRFVVIKKILPVLSNDPQFSEMFIAEAKLSSLLSHKNIVQVFDLGRIDNELYIAMEYVEGYDLNTLLKKCTKKQLPISLDFALFIITEVLQGLDYAHRAKDQYNKPLGIIHRDVSPTNVLISFEGEIKLCDFGIAKAMKRDSYLPEGVLKGKFAYMAPEQAAGEYFDQKADLFAAGILLWELIAGRRMYKADLEEKILELAQKGEIPELPKKGLINEELLHSIIYKSLSQKPEDRFQTAGEFRNSVEDYIFKSNLVSNQLKFATFLKTNFDEELRETHLRRESTLQKVKDFEELEKIKLDQEGPKLTNTLEPTLQSITDTLSERMTIKRNESYPDVDEEYELPSQKTDYTLLWIFIPMLILIIIGFVWLFFKFLL